MGRVLKVDTNAQYPAMPKSLQNDEVLAHDFAEVMHSFHPGHWRPSDIPMMVQYVKANRMVLDAYDDIDERGLILEDGTVNPSQRIIKDMSILCVQIGTKLGIMAITRTSTKIPKAKEDAQDGIDQELLV